MVRYLSPFFTPSPFFSLATLNQKNQNYICFFWNKKCGLNTNNLSPYVSPTPLSTPHYLYTCVVIRVLAEGCGYIRILTRSTPLLLRWFNGGCVVS